jgi:hypothetical protein
VIEPQRAHQPSDEVATVSVVAAGQDHTEEGIR